MRRILVGEADQRAQGLLTRLGIERAYVMVNTYLYSVYGQQAGEQHATDPALAAYRHRWLDALLSDRQIEAVIAFGHLADQAFRAWQVTPAGTATTAPTSTSPTPPSPTPAATAGPRSRRR